MMVRDFQSVIGRECLTQMPAAAGRDPDAVIACVGGGRMRWASSIRTFRAPSVRLIGVEAAGDGIDTGRHAASLTAGRPGVLHGNRTYLLQDADGQIIETHSISAGLDYPGVGPEHAWLKDTGRAEYVTITDDEALAAFHDCCRIEGIIPALESAHALAYAAQLAATLPKDKILLVNLSGRGDKDMHTVAERSGLRVLAPPRGDAGNESHRRHVREAPRGGPHRAHPVRHRRRSDARARRCRSCTALVAAGADVIELGVPFSDPMADGPVIQRASERALAQGVGLADVLDVVARVPQGRRDDADRADGLRQSDRGDGHGRVRRSRARRRRRRRARRRLSARGSRGVRRAPRRARHRADLPALADDARGADRRGGEARARLRLLRFAQGRDRRGASRHRRTCARKLAEIRRHVQLPVGVGFGIRDAASAQAIAADADAVVIGSRIIQEIEAGPADAAAERAGAWLAGIRKALDSMQRRAA